MPHSECFCFYRLARRLQLTHTHTSTSPPTFHPPRGANTLERTPERTHLLALHCLLQQAVGNLFVFPSRHICVVFVVHRHSFVRKQRSSKNDVVNPSRARHTKSHSHDMCNALPNACGMLMLGTVGSHLDLLAYFFVPSSISPSPLHHRSAFHLTIRWNCGPITCLFGWEVCAR